MQNQKWKKNTWVTRIAVQKGGQYNDVYTFTNQNNPNLFMCFRRELGNCQQIQGIKLKQYIIDKAKLHKNTNYVPHVCAEPDQAEVMECEKN